MYSQGSAWPRQRKSDGIDVRHQRSCSSSGGAPCDCTPSYRAECWSPRDKKKLRKTFASVSAAKAWRHETAAALNRGTLRVPVRRTLDEAAALWLQAAKAGVARNRSGERFKPSTLRGYEHDLEHYVLPALGGMRVAELRRGDVQGLSNQILASGLSPSKVHNAVVALKVVYRWLSDLDEVATNPTLGVRLPAVGGARERVAGVAEADALLAALPPELRALYATALLAGLRRGELRALRVQDLHLDESTISVEAGWDDREGRIEPKSKSSKRKAPVPPQLAQLLREWLVASGRRGGDFLFGTTAATVFTPSNVATRAAGAWRRAELSPGIGLHECRHSFASWARGAGIPREDLEDYLGHSRAAAHISDRYIHGMQGREQRAGEQLGRWLEEQHPGFLRAA